MKSGFGFALVAAFVLTTCSSGGQVTSMGSKLTLRSLRGKAVYLNYFETWCPPSNEEAPAINALQKQYGSRGQQVVGIDELENQKKTASFVLKFGLVYPAIVDDGTLQSQYQINELPGPHLHRPQRHHPENCCRRNVGKADRLG